MMIIIVKEVLLVGLRRSMMIFMAKQDSGSAHARVTNSANLLEERVTTFCGSHTASCGIEGGHKE